MAKSRSFPSHAAPVRAHNRAELPLVVLIPGGRFVMGSEFIAAAEAPNPPHSVTLSSYWMGVHPITNAEYRAFLEATGTAAPSTLSAERFGRPDQPVVGVGFRDAEAYCAWAAGALPSEAQWEFCARGLDGRRYPWGDEEPDDSRACFAQDWNRGHPSPIGAHPAGVGPFGCHDLAGNVWEWCRDSWHADAHVERTALGRDPCLLTRATATTEATGATKAAGSIRTTGTAGATTNRVRPLRGGCWRSIDGKLQGAYRNWSHEAARHTTIGFRLCVPQMAAPPI